MSELFNDSSMELYNDNWFFLEPQSGSATTAGQIPPQAVSVTLPHAWNAEGWSYEPQTYDDPAGTGWYFKYLPDRAGDLLRFEGVAAECEVYLNGRLVKKNLGAYKPFEVELTGLCGDGTDLLAVQVTDKQHLVLLPEDCDPVFSVSPRFFRWPLPMGSSLNAGGIWRDVWMVRRGQVFMRPAELRSAPETLTILPDISGNAVGYTLKCALSKDGKPVVKVECAATDKTLSMTVKDYREWLPLRPELYELESSLYDKSGQLLQTISQPAAFFDLCVRDSGFYLNGRPYFLRGQNGFPHCNVPHDREYIARYVTEIHLQGVEISRFHT
ncbi:MAG: hypothetical protein PHV59_03465 [Victivallales bacterium]|nr:hypothetical protein [Victivallales bacterium]